MAEKKLGFFGKVAKFFKELPSNIKNLPKTCKEGLPKAKKYLKYNWQIYVLFVPTLIWITMFVFIPFVTNVIMSMQDYNTTAGIFGSEFVGFKNYIAFFSAIMPSYYYF